MFFQFSNICNVFETKQFPITLFTVRLLKIIYVTDSRRRLPNIALRTAAFLNTCVHFCLDLFFIHSLITRMLQRDPKRRASLEEIENHAWLQGVDPSPATKYNIPLVSYKNLSEEEHNSIIQRMVLGDIADRDTIVE